MSVREQDRMAVLRQVDEGMLPAAGAAWLGVTRRHFRRLMRRFEAEGDGAAVHRLRGRRSNQAPAPEVREGEPVSRGVLDSLSRVPTRPR